MSAELVRVAPTLLVMRGPSGAGKTRTARGWCAADPTRRVRLSRADLRRTMAGGAARLHAIDLGATLVQQLMLKAVFGALGGGLGVVIDDPHKHSRDLALWRWVARKTRAQLVVIDLT